MFGQWIVKITFFDYFIGIRGTEAISTLTSAIKIELNRSGQQI